MRKKAIKMISKEVKRIKSNGALRQTVMVIAGVAVIGSQTVAAQSAGATIGDTLCEMGLGILIAAGIYIGALALFGMAAGDAFRAVKSSGGGSRRRAETGGHTGSAGKKVVGAIGLVAAPTILSNMGFTLISCLSDISVTIF